MNSKILVDLERLRYPNSGIANVFRNLAKGLQNQNTSLEISYFGVKKELSKINTSRPLSVVEWKKWHKFFERFSMKFDVIHVSHQLSSYFHKKYQSALKIVTLHDLNFLHENLSTRERKKMLKRVNDNLKNTDYIICISNFVKKDLLKHQQMLSLNKLKEIEVIYNGIELPEEREYNLGKFQYLKNEKYLLNIGVLFEKKNQKSLVEMLAYISGKLVLVSSGEKEPYANEVRKKVEELNLKHRVIFLKNVTEEEKYALLQNCESYVHPSLAEGFGIPPIEAMAFGKPVFLSTLTSLPEIGGTVAYYFDNFDPENMADTYMKGVNDYHKNSAENSKRIRNWASQFDYQIMARNYHHLYESILAVDKRG